MEDQMILLDTTNHILGGYIRTAISDALSGKNKYPDEALVKKNLKKKDNEQMSDEQMLRMAQRNTAIIAGRQGK